MLLFGDFAKTIQSTEWIEIKLRVGAIIYYVFPASTFLHPFSNFEKRLVAFQIEYEQADFPRFVFRVVADDIAQKHV